MIRAIILAALLPVAALAQIQLFQFDGTTETPVGSLYQLPTSAPGDNTETRFRVRNNGTGPVTLQTLSVAGTNFRISSQPTLPYIIASGQFTDFKVMFSPTAIGSYSANLQVNSVLVLLRSSVAAAASLSQGSTMLSAGATVDFGKIQRGTGTALGFTLSNPNNTAVTVSSIAVSGDGFQGPSGITAPLTLSPGQSAAFQIAFSPPAGQPYTGTLLIDQRAFQLSGQGLDPPLPKASIVIDPGAGLSGQQTHVSIALASPSQVAGTGTLVMEFHPAVSGVKDDPAVLFLSGPARVATFTIAPNESIGRFNGNPNMAFQTGTTAGAIVFTLVLPNSTTEATLTIAPAITAFNTATGTRLLGELDVSLIGFDNTQSATAMSFTFYDAKGVVVAPGPISVDATSAFKTYFASAQSGGAFALRAAFPVTGDTSKISSVDVEMTNSAGVAKAQRITF